MTTTFNPDAAAVRDFVATFQNSTAAWDMAAALQCTEADALAALLVALGAPDLAEDVIGGHAAEESECAGHDERAEEPETFFAPNRTYRITIPSTETGLRTLFQCEGVAVHPSENELKALGFVQVGGAGEWRTMTLTPKVWAFGWEQVQGAAPDGS